jgi:amino acid transporter
VLVAYAIFGLFVFINAISTRAAKGISTVATVAESLPLISIGVLGLVFGGIVGWKGNFFNQGTGNNFPDPNGKPWTDNVNIIGILASLPSILFSFDSFLAVGNAANSMKEPEKTIPRSILIGIPIVIVCYLSVTIGQMVTGSRDVYSFFLHIVDHNNKSPAASTAVNIVVGCIVMLCLVGSINAFALTAIRSFGSSIDHDILMGSVKIKQLRNGKKMHEVAIYVFIAGTIVTALMAVITIIPNSDSAYDILSSLQTLFFFGVYGLVILYGLINHYTNKVAVKKMKLFPVVAVIAIFGSFLALGYNLIYVLTIQTFTSSNDYAN